MASDSRTRRRLVSDADRLNKIETAKSIAQAFHTAYEALAPVFGYRTREAGAKPWADVPQKNRELMVATVLRLLDNGVIASPAASRQSSAPGRAVYLHDVDKWLGELPTEIYTADDLRELLEQAFACQSRSDNAS